MKTYRFFPGICLGFLLFWSVSILSAQPNDFIRYPDEKTLSLSKDARQHLAVIKARPTSVSVRVIQFQNLPSVASQRQLQLPIMGLGQFVVIATKIKVSEAFKVFWSGELQENKGKMFFTAVNGDVYGMIHVGQSVFSIEPLGTGVHALIELDQSKFGPDEPPGAYSNSQARKSQEKQNSTSPSFKSFGGKSIVSIPTIDVLVAYTPAVANSQGNMSTFIASCIQSANETFANSGVNAEASLVHSVQVNYTESGSVVTDDNRLQNSNDGYMDDVHSLRSQYGADVVVLLVDYSNDNYNGVAYGIEVSASGAFCVVKDDPAVSNYTFAHEIGHLIGCRHDYNADPNGTYNHGYVYSSGGWRTVMALPYTGITRIPYWSSPNNIYGGVSMGTVSLEDNARKWNERASTVAGFLLRPIYIPQDYPTIESGLAAAVNGQRVVVSSGLYTISSNLTVSPGVTLQIYPGSTLNFAGYYKLSIQGMLVASGVTFQGNGSSGSWFGIELGGGTNNDIQNCTIKDAQYGFLFTSSYAGTYMNNSIRNNSQGISLSSYSDPSFFQNGFTGNGIDVYGDNTSAPDLGSLPGSGYNSFRSYTQVYSSYPGTIYANFNWWGSYPANPNVTSNVDYSNALSYDPIPSLKITDDGTIASRGLEAAVIPPITTASIQNLDNDALNELNAAYKLFITSNYAAALSAYEAVVSSYPTTFAAKRALVFIERCLDKLGRSAEIFERLNTLAAHYQGSSLGNFLQIRTASAIIKAGNYNGAMQQLSAAINQMIDSTDLKISLYVAGSLAFYHLGDRSAAEKYFGQLVQIFPLDALSKSALIILGDQKSQQTVNRPPLTSSGSGSRESDFVLSNYPNPFNPTTTIHFTLPQDGVVSLKVFDILGREVMTLLNEYRNAGLHQVNFNALSLTSGVYFYKLETAGKIAMQKMILLK